MMDSIVAWSITIGVVSCVFGFLIGSFITYRGQASYEKRAAKKRWIELDEHPYRLIDPDDD